MAVSNFFALLDDIATLLDDVSVMAKVAVKKTAGVLGDDLALNAQQVTGVTVDRELPVVWAVAKGSMVNKAILVPLALAVSVWLPAVITPLLMLGGLYLCFEGVEKLAHRYLHSAEEDQQHASELRHAVTDASVDLLAFEKDKIKGAIRTDFVLSAEIIVITLGTIAQASFLEKGLVLSGVAVLMTVMVYGLVAGIVRLDDAGVHLLAVGRQKASAWRNALGGFVLALAPRLMKFLSVAGTAAMFLVGGSIIGHGLPFTHDWFAAIAGFVGQGGWGTSLAGIVLPMLLDALIGVLAGVLALAVFMVGQKLFKRQPLV
jgi:predicted DNA repair protein MutK